MVARKNSADSRPSGRSPLGVWQGLLGRLWHGVQAIRDSLSGIDGGSPFRSLVRWSPLILGAVAVIGGRLLATAAAVPQLSASAALASSVSLVLWLALGLAVIWWVAGPPSGGPRSVFDAWAFGLIPWVAAALPLLQFLAWVASAAVTIWALKRVLPHTRAAVRVVGAAWATQAAVATLLWLWAPAWLMLSAS